MQQSSSPQSRLVWVFPLVLIVSLFFLWGMANNLNDILIAQFKKVFQLSDFGSGLVQSAFYLGYFIFAIPAAIFANRFSYKTAVIAGLMLYAAGAFLFYPASLAREYSIFLIGLFVIASGLAFLETCANPLVLALGDPSTAARRLNFAQSFNPLGCLTGIWIGREFILSGHEPTASELSSMSAAQLEQFYQTESQAVQLPYLVIGGLVLAWALLIAITRFPKVATETHRNQSAAESVGTWADYLFLLKNKLFMFGVAAQFFYVGAQVCLWSYTIRYGKVAMPLLGEKQLADYLFISLVVFMAGRFIATALMTKIKPALLLLSYAVMSGLLCGVALMQPNQVGMIALVATSFFMSLMFPTIFALALQDVGPRVKTASSLVIMSIVGGAAITALMGYVSDQSTIQTSVLVPLGCFVVIAFYAMKVRKL